MPNTTFQIPNASNTIIDRLGRRVLLVASEVIMCSCLVAIGVYFYLKHQVCSTGIHQNCKNVPCLVAIGVYFYLKWQAYPNHMLDCKIVIGGFTFISISSRKFIQNIYIIFLLLSQVDPGSSDTLQGGNCKFWLIINWKIAWIDK